MNLKSQLVRSFMGVGIMRLLSIPIALATSIILARTLGPEEFGRYAFVMALIPLIGLPAGGGLQQLLTREVATFAHSKSWPLYQGALRASHAWVLIATTAIFSSYWGLRAGFNVIPTDGKWSLLPIALIMVPLGGLAAIRTGTIKGLGFPAYAELPSQLIQPAALLAMLTALTWKGALDTKAAIWSQVAGAGLVFVLASWMFLRIQPLEAKGLAATYRLEYWKSALLPFCLIALVSTFNVQTGVIVLGLISTDEQVAAMRVAERGGQFVVLSLSLVNMVIAPHIVRALREGDKGLLQQLARRSARGSFLLALPIATLLILGGEPLIRIAFGADYSGISYWPVVIVAVGQLFNVFFGSVGYFLSMSGNERETLKGQILAVTVNATLCLLLAPRFGAIGAATGVAVGLVTWNVLLFAMVKRRIGINCAAY